MTQIEKTFNFPQWVNSILISLLLITASASLLQNKHTQKSLDLLTIQVAVVSNQVQTHISWGENVNLANTVLMNSNEARLDAIEARQEKFMTQEEIMRQFELIRDYCDKNYVRKTSK